jgi:hypothetical protein
MAASGNDEDIHSNEDSAEIVIPAEAETALAEAFVVAIVKCTQSERSHYLQYFVQILHEIHAPSNIFEYVAHISGRSLKYLRDLLWRGPEDDEIARAAPSGVQRPRRPVDSAIEQFLTMKSRCVRNYRVLDAHVGVDLAAEFFEFISHLQPATASYQYLTVTEKHIDKIRKSLHVRRCPHEYLDVYSCDLCRLGVRDNLVSKLKADPTNSELHAQLTQLDYHVELKTSQISYYFERLRRLQEQEAIAIIDHSKAMSMTDRYPLTAIVVITKNADTHKYVYDHFLYGTSVGYAGTWKMAQIALQDFLRTFGSRFRRIDIFHDSFYGDFRNHYMLLFYSIAVEAFRAHNLCTPRVV